MTKQAKRPTLESLEKAVKGLSKHVAGVNAYMTKWVNSIAEKQGNMDIAQTELRDEHKAVVKNWDTIIHDVRTNLRGGLTRMDHLASIVNRLDGQVVTIFERVDKLAAAVAQHPGAIDAQAQALSYRITVLAEEVGKIKIRIDNDPGELWNEVRNLGGRLDLLESRLNRRRRGPIEFLKAWWRARPR